METLDIEDLKNLIKEIDFGIEVSAHFRDEKKCTSLKKSRAIIEQMIKDREFEQSQTTLNKL